MTTYHFSLLLVIALLLAACGEKQAPPEQESKAPPAKPWKWEPAEPELAKGRQIYLAECALCHNDGEENAPPLTSETQWATRADKGLETLIKHAIEGFHGEDGEMPARGGTETLTDEEVAAAVKFMIAAPK